MKYLTGEKMTFGYAAGEKVLADPKTCSHPKKVYRGRWVCERCGKETK